MLKCVCEKACQARRDKDGKILTFKAGEVAYFKKCPKNFRVISGAKAKLADDLDKVSEAELLEGDYTIQQLRKYAREVYDKKLKGTTKEDVVASFLDARFRHLKDHELEGVL